MASSNTGDNDPLMADLIYLAKQKLLTGKLKNCTALLGLLPDKLIPTAGLPLDKPDVLWRVFQEIARRNLAALKETHENIVASQVMAASTVIGVVTDPPDEDYKKSLNELMERPRAWLKENRQNFAGAWLHPSVSTRKGFYNHERDCLEAFRRALLDFLQDEQAVHNLALRLGTVPIAETTPSEATPAKEPAPAPQPQPSWLSVHRKPVVFGTAGVLVIGLGLGLGLSLGLSSSPSPTTGSTGNGGSSNTTIGLPPGGKTYTEQEAHVGENWTYANPFDPAVTGPGVQPLQKVQVSCKVYAPSMGSVSPAGYWYRLASPPYDNHDYGIANTYLNGNPVTGTSNVKQINVDQHVPDCPS